MHVGFTGTQLGMSDHQKEKFAFLLMDILYEDNLDREDTFFHHGDCVGADAQAHDIVKLTNKVFVIIHPPTLGEKRALCKGDLIKEPAPYLQRNMDIVNSSELIVVAPKSDREELRSGTWATYRYAMKLGKAVILLER